MRRLLPPILTALAALGLWQGLPMLWHVPEYLIPTPGAIYQALIRESGFLIPAAGRTAFAATAGLSAAIAGGVLLASIFTLSPVVRRCFLPWVLILQMTPVIVVVPLLAIWLGAGLGSIVAVTFLISFFPITAAAAAGLNAVNVQQLELFKVMKASTWQVFWKLRVPTALPQIVTGVKIAATLATVGAVSGEYMAGTNPAQSGLGYLLVIYWSRTETAAVFAVAGTACVVGYAFVAAVNYFGSRILARK